MNGTKYLSLLMIEDEGDLRDRTRLRQLYQCRQLSNIVFGICFEVIAICFIVLTVMAFQNREELGGWVGYASFFTTVFFAGFGWIPIKNALADPIRGYLKQPYDYEFTDAQIEKSAYVWAEKGGRGSYFATIRSEQPRILAVESLPADAFPFVEPEQEEQLLGPDSTVEKKRKSIRLPVTVFLLYRRTFLQDACLVAIPSEVFNSL